MYSSYGKLCTALYDFTKPTGYSIDGDMEYYESRLKNVKGKVLEAGVGSGRVLLPFLATGMVIEGIDNSEEMLAACRDKAKALHVTPTLYNADLSDFSLGKTYEAVIVPSGTFCLIEDAKGALQSFYNHLTAGGKVVIDLLLPIDFVQGEITTDYFEMTPTTGISLESKSVEIDWVAQRTITYLKYEQWQDGVLQEAELQKFTLYWYGVREFMYMLEEVGFTDITVSTDYTFGKQPTATSSLLTFEAIKK